ncbi:MAG: hypothetical protein EBR30_14455 [Cytophagia bacterium]|nr:hypothetical protein [Cytophagia bacterium]
MRQIFILIFITISYPVNAQTRTITGKVIDEYFDDLPGVHIQNSDTIQLGTTDINGEFEIEIPINTDSLLFGFIGMELTPIKLTAKCDRIEIVMMVYVSYHNKSGKQIDKLRKKRFDNLSKIHSIAFSKGQFLSDKPCYERKFMEQKQALGEIEREMIEVRKQNKDLFDKLKVGDIIQVPFSGTYRSDGTNRTTLMPWAYFTDGTKSQCIIEGIITTKDKRNSGYNIEIRVTDLKSCKYETPIVYQEKDMVVGTVFRHNMRILKVLSK